MIVSRKSRASGIFDGADQELAQWFVGQVTPILLNNGYYMIWGDYKFYRKRIGIGFDTIKYSELVIVANGEQE